MYDKAYQMNNNLTHASLFSGIGGFDLAAEWAGFQNIFHCDYDTFCRQALDYNFPNSDSHSDITKQTFQNTMDKSHYLPEDSPANHSPSQEREKEQMTLVTSVHKCLEQLKRSDQLGLLVKMLLVSPRCYSPVRLFQWRVKPLNKRRIVVSSKPQNQNLLSSESVTILSKKDIQSNRLLFRLVASVRPTKGTECGLSHDLMKTNLLPTPLASDATMGAIIGKEDKFRITSTGMPRKINRNGVDGSVGLARLMKLWDLLPTPTATDATRGGEILKGKTKLCKSGQKFSATLNDLARSGLLPTPVAPDKNGGSTRTDPKRQFTCALQDYVHGVAMEKNRSLIGHSSQLNPHFTQEIMGFPDGWVEKPFLMKN